MRGSVEIQPFRLAQLPRLLEIEAACFPQEPYSEDLFRHYHRRCPQWFFIAKRRRRIAGYVIIRTESDRAEVISIAVDPAHRRAGAGNALLSYTLEKLVAVGVTTVELMVRSSDAGAIVFYRKLGFEKVREVRNYYSGGGDALLMNKQLPAPRKAITVIDRSPLEGAKNTPAAVSGKRGHSHFARKGGISTCHMRSKSARD